MTGKTMSRRLQLIGRKYGQLTVIAEAPLRGKGGASRTWWLCECECGTRKEIAGQQLQSGGSNSCGCLKDKIHAARLRTHGQHGTVIYKRWAGMLARCNPFGKEWTQNHGDRGIQVCDRWQKFENFYADMNASYEAHVKKYGIRNTTLERLDVNGHYTPENTTWATHTIQARNRRTNVFITFNGETLTRTEWASRIGIHQSVLAKRIKNGWSLEDALTLPATR